MSAASRQYGEIFDRGYVHYDGPRLGQQHAIWALARYSMARALGLRRSWTAKIIPLLLYAAVAVPVVISVGVRSFFPAADLFGYPEYFAGIYLVEGVFVAMIAPEMMSSDRHDHVLPLYFSRPIGRSAYVVAKLIGAGILTLSMSLLPAVVLWLGTGLLSKDPLAALQGSLDDLGRIVVAGTMIAFYLGAIGLTIASFTGRKSVAVGVTILGFVISETLAVAILQALRDQPELGRWSFALSPSRTIGAMVSELFGQDVFEGIPLSASLGVMAWVIAICLIIMFVWYRRRD
jgi:ABC-2 type transport system permease protein